MGGKMDIGENISLVLKDSLGNIIAEENISNTITDLGISRVLDRLGGLSGDAVGYIAIGTGTTASSASDTSLQTEVERQAVTPTKPTSSSLQYTHEFVATSTDNYDITEVGLFDVASNGTMFNRAVGTAKPWVFGNSLTVTITISLTRA